MTYYPNSREPLEKRFFTKGDEKAKLNYYYEGLLGPEDKNEMRWYDYGVSDAICGLDNLEAAFEMLDFDIEEKLSEKELDFLLDDRTTRILRLALVAWAEGERNENVIGKLEYDPEDSDYEERVALMKQDYESLSEEDFLKKYASRYYNERALYEDK